ncbi:MAG TPA: transposase [Blastocatellia bacterium]|nr:transposase [Blastocatellia bacterium]
MAALAHQGRCLPFLAAAYQIKNILRSQNQAEHSFFLLLSLLKRANQQLTCIKDRGFARIGLLRKMDELKLHFITGVCHNTYFASDHYQGILRDLPVRAGQVLDLGWGLLGKDKKNQVRVRLIAYLGRGHKAPWLIATDRSDLTASQVVSLYAKRMGIEAGFRDSKGLRYGWGVKQIRLQSDGQLTLLWAAAMVAYGLQMAAGASLLKQDDQAQFNWTKKGPRRSLLAVGRNVISSGMMKGEQIVRQLPKLALRLSELKMVVIESQSDSRAMAASGKS